jgi:glycosyltransferase involved in cell wall biosynthesis
MKIGIICDPPLITHSCSVVGSQLAKQFVKHGHEVFYLGYNYTGEKVSHPDGYDIYPDTVPPTRKQSVLDFIDKTGVEILYAHGSKDIFSEGMDAAKERGIPYVPHTFYSTPVKNDVVNTFEAKNGFILYDCDKVDDMVVCNNFSVGVGFALGKRTWFVPNGVDTDIFRPSGKNYRKELNIPKDAFVVLYSGSNISGKDPGRAIDVFAEFSKGKDNIYLALHTRPTNSHLDLRQIAIDRGIEDKVKFFTDYFPEWLEQPEADANYQKGSFSPPYTTTPYNLMGNVFRTGNIQLVTTLMEGMSTTILEGMACSLTTICSDDPVVSEPVVNFSTGYLVHRHLTNECKIDEMVEILNFLYTHQDFIKQAGQNASNLVQIKYNWEVIASQLEYIFNTLIQKKYN